MAHSLPRSDGRSRPPPCCLRRATTGGLSFPGASSRGSPLALPFCRALSSVEGLAATSVLKRPPPPSACFPWRPAGGHRGPSLSAAPGASAAAISTAATLPSLSIECCLLYRPCVLMLACLAHVSLECGPHSLATTLRRRPPFDRAPLYWRRGPSPSLGRLPATPQSSAYGRYYIVGRRPYYASACLGLRRSDLGRAHVKQPPGRHGSAI